MILFPAIDLKDGQCVRLVHGLMDQATVFNDNPAAQARAFEDAGFDYIVVVRPHDDSGAPDYERHLRSTMERLIAQWDPSK